VKNRLGSGPGGVKEIMSHPFFNGINWANLRNTTAPYIPRIDSPTDTRSEPQQQQLQLQQYFVFFQVRTDICEFFFRFSTL
jgi:hypothetical protein